MTEEKRNKAILIAEEIRSNFYSTLSNVKWLKGKTKEKALNKL